MTDSILNPGQFAYVGVSFVEERNASALVRLPNGSKTSVRFNALRTVGPDDIHFTRRVERGGETARCLACNWSEDFDTRVEAEDVALTHRSHCADLTPDQAQIEDGQLTYDLIGWPSIEIVVTQKDGVTLVANADGLLTLARLFEQMAGRAQQGDHIHLHPGLNLSPASQPLTVARSDDGTLPNAGPTPGKATGGRTVIT